MAGAYIKDFDKPENCESCKLATHYERYGQEDYCPFMGWYGDYDKCPIFAVPDHGRLIDADELAAQCDEPYFCVWLSDIDDAPTVLPADK